MSKIEKLVEEIEKLSDELDSIRHDAYEIKELPTDTINDEMKTDFLIENWDKITLEMLEGLVK